MTDQEQQKKPVGMYKVLFLFLAIGVAAAGIYVKNSGDGNQTIAADGNIDIQALKNKAMTVENAATGDVAAMIAVEEPFKMPEHSFITDDGAAMSLDDFSGKVLLVNLWATWCAPCREEMPALSELRALKSGDDFDVITINIDRGGREKPQGFLADVGIDNLALYQDNTMGIFNALKKEGIAIGLPVTMLVDENGYILGSMNGPAHWSGVDAQNYIDAAIKAKGV